MRGLRVSGADTTDTARHFLLDFPRAWPLLPLSADFRSLPEDFQVDEDLGFAPSGQGEHSLLQLRKRGANSAWVAGRIAALVGCDQGAVGYCGRKDRHALTSQWFSVAVSPRREPDWRALEQDDIQLLQFARHSKKLRRGDHRGNHFIIRLRRLAGADRDSLEGRLRDIFARGVPNYFGEQRFGREAGNLHRAQRLLQSGGWRRRHRGEPGRDMALSAARAWLFNLVLAERVRREQWRLPLAGESAPAATGPLWGRGRHGGLPLEAEVLAPWADWCEMLEHTGMTQERRSLVLLPREGGWRWPEPNTLELRFFLHQGEFATAVLRELGRLENRAATV